MDTGLFTMYGFLLLLAAGIFIYAKIDDRKETEKAISMQCRLVKYVCRSYAFRLRNDSIFQN